MSYKASRTGPASAPGGIANTGVMINVTPVSASSRYIEQVRRIAPPELVGRAAELAELAGFCADPSSRYAWWRAPAWTGKSALMSWFVLHPPAGVRVVSFFVTSRYAAQSDRRAFCANVLEQLCTLLGEPMPTFTDATLDAQILGKLTDAAMACQAANERLVLLVDGLDEDRGTDGHSIAALIPAELPTAMSVIVAGRPDPPLPDDLAPDHPLRDPAIVRSLRQSAVAQAEQLTMKRDLNTLMESEVDILGLLVAAGGGLTRTDLAELTGREPWDVEDALRMAAGRSFTRRTAYWRSTDEIYLLAHEELLLSAKTMLGQRLEGYRERLHTWADSYKEAGWPESTPEYLLLGYARMLDSDLDRRVDLATDKARHDRMHARSGGHLAAAEEIAELLNVLVEHENPDLSALVRLGIHHDRFSTYFTSIPSNLPEAWAILGHFDRAEQLARGMSRYRHTDALVRVAKRMAQSGQKERAERLLSSTNTGTSVLDTFDEDSRESHADRAETEHQDSQSADPTKLTSRAIHRAVTGDHSAAVMLAEQAENVALSQTDITQQCHHLSFLAHAATIIGEHSLARSLATDACCSAFATGTAIGSRCRALSTHLPTPTSSRRQSAYHG